MKLKKHIHLFVKIMCIIISRSDVKRFNASQLKDKINEELTDKKLAINAQHIIKIIRKQNDYEAEKTLNYYIFKEKEKKE